MKINKIELSIQIKQSSFTENYYINGHNKYMLKAFLNWVLFNNVIYFSNTGVFKTDIRFVSV